MERMLAREPDLDGAVVRVGGRDPRTEDARPESGARLGPGDRADPATGSVAAAPTGTGARLLPDRLVAALALADLSALGWMVLVGAWLDHRGALALLTLGGHHVLVAALAVVSLVMLTVGRVLSAGPNLEVGIFTLAAAVAAVAVAGLLGLALLVLLVAVFAGLLVRLSRR